jgi:hypothetical protein
MRTKWAATLAVVVLSWTAGPGRADDSTSARAVVEQGIKAQGGADALERGRTLSRTGSGTMSVSGSTVPFTEETLIALPDRVRITVDLSKGQRLTLVVNGDKAWQIVGGTVFDLSKDRVEEVREEAYVLWLALLTPLLSDAFTLSPLPDGSVEGSPTAGVKVSSKGHADAKLYFDKRSGLLVKIERRGREAGVLLTKTYVFGDYKDVDGVKLPVRESQLLDGKKFIERTSATYKLIRRADDAAFSKP